jgi:hypothetical protein
MSTGRYILFDVEYIKPQAGSVLVVGRSLGHRIVVGDRFRMTSAPGRSQSPSEWVEGLNVDLFVAAIEPWGQAASTGRDWDYVDRPFSAPLELWGEGGEQSKPYCVLAGWQDE